MDVAGLKTSSSSSVYSPRHHLVQGPESESLCLPGPDPQQSDDLTIQIAAQSRYQILNLDIV